MLPNELLANIVSHAGFEDLKRLRQCNHFLADAAAAYLFATVRVLYTKDSFDKLHSVASAEHLNRHVRHLIYSGHMFPRDWPLEWWKLRSTHLLPTIPLWVDANPGDEALQTSYETYQRVTDEQRVGIVGPSVLRG